MITEIENTDTLRSGGARLGVTLLNLLMPGLGLLRLTHLKEGLFYGTSQVGIVGVLIGYYAFGPPLSYSAFMIIVVSLVSALLCLYGASIIATWRRSKAVATSPPWWTRWYGLLLVWIVIGIASQLVTYSARSYYRFFYMPAESMAPALARNDRFVANMRDTHTPRRGDIVVFKNGKVEYVKRIIGLPGDRVAMKGGVPIVNGVAATQAMLSSGLIADEFEGKIIQRYYLETLPGSAARYRVIDRGSTPADDWPETSVPQGRLFVLGDNRDRSADSRYGAQDGGTGMVPIVNISGRPSFIYWSDDRGKIGSTIR